MSNIVGFHSLILNKKILYHLHISFTIYKNGDELHHVFLLKTNKNFEEKKY